MTEEVLFIADLHLTPAHPVRVRLFIQFLQQRARQAQALYILGDLFDVWIGDDDNSHFSKVLCEQLRQAVASGLVIYLQPGNRDFLLGNHFARQTGVRLLPDYHRIELLGEPVLLTHGDLLCTDDMAYQRFRHLSRTPEWRENVLAKPLWLRRGAARWYRLRSFWHKRGQTAMIMDVNADAVAQVIGQYKVKRLIHGHTHRPATHTLTLGGFAAERIVLSDWRGVTGCCLSVSAENGYRHEHF
ncbi:MAG: UDP-2,3-diacylglucosamine diphosphatase [Methylococcales bacterium]|nr:UDP-2,3-diacylglucosamine diphosphatase [Methylococcales bacterium]